MSAGMTRKKIIKNAWAVMMTLYSGWSEPKYLIGPEMKPHRIEIVGNCESGAESGCGWPTKNIKQAAKETESMSS